MPAEMIEAEGVIAQSHPGDTHSVMVELAGQSRRVIAKRSGALNQRFLRVIPGDRVIVEISPYDLRAEGMISP